jgi:hypothetical protein
MPSGFPRLLPLAVVALALSGCNVVVEQASSTASSTSQAGGSVPPAVVATATPTPLLYGVCQLAVNGHNARVTVGGDGVSSAVCSSLLASLGSQLGWSLSTAPPPTVPTSDVICAIPASLLPKADQGVVTDSGAFGTTDGSAACTALAQASVAGPCPSPITGVISGAGNRIPLEVEISGPSGKVTENAILDTGGVDEYFPDSDLRSAGFSPTGTTTSSLGGWSGTVNEYSLPASALLVLDGEAYVPIATGTLVVFGAPSVAFSGGIEPLIGPNVLQQGAELSSSGSQWALTPPCSA